MTTPDVPVGGPWGAFGRELAPAELPQESDPNAVGLLYEGEDDSYMDPAVVTAVFRSEAEVRRYVECEVRVSAQRVDRIGWYCDDLYEHPRCWWLGLPQWRKATADPLWNLVDRTYKRWTLTSVELSDADAPPRNPLAE